MESHPSPIYFLTSQECSWLQKPRAAAEHASSPPLAWPPDSLELAPASAPGVKHLHRANQEMGSTTVHLLFMKESLIENMPEKRETQTAERAQSTWGSVLGVAPSNGTEIKWQLWIHAQTSWGLGCGISLGHISPVPREGRLGSQRTVAVGWNTCVVSWAPHLREKMTILNLENALGLTEKAQNK